MQDNTKRGERALFWMKSIFMIFVLYFFWSSPINAAFPASNDNLVTPSVLVRIAFGAVISFGMLFSLFAFLVYFFSWLHRTIENLRVLTVTDFSPMGAVLLSCIPFVGFLLHFWIFNDIVDRQHDCMHERGILKENFPKKFLVAWILVSVGCFAVMFVDGKGSFIKDLIENILTVVSLGLYIKCFSIYIARERELFQFHTETLFRKRVDEAIRERDIARAADQLRDKQ
ncbi:hypothetical protein [Fibrobacter sp. UBA4297]|uniref:hypothetical protein n=1 Tax=Fibrobacter sp. UBA4297 TaxID=1946536 RepID=UPI0025C3209D|nr:hypothetical protein [Fibrobacter sp. UBA4297]